MPLPRKKKKIHTLIEDIHHLLQHGKEELDQDNLKEFLSVMQEEVERFLQPYEGERKRLRLSAVGRTDRKLWYEINDPIPRKETPQLRMRFFYGHILEALLLYLATEAGHKVEHKQAEVVVEGIKGHIDAVIDGVLVDVKSASDYGFKKFKDGNLVNDDPFGYIAQISSYMEGMELEEGAFFAINKNSGDLCLLQMDELMTINASERVRSIKKIVASKDIPDKCYDDKPEGASGNRIIDKGCSFCDYKYRCWSDANNGVGLRTFKYSNGWKHFTKVLKEPNVAEVL